MLYDFVVGMLGGSLPAVYGFVPYIVSGLLLFVFVACLFNFFINTMLQFFFKS